MKLEFAQILSSAGQISWKHKILWMLAAPVGFAAGLICLSIFGFNSDGTLISAFIQDEIRGITQNLPPFTDKLIILMLCFIAFAFYLLNLMGSIAIIKVVSEVKNGENHLPAGKLLSKSRPFFRRFFSLHFPLHLAYLLLITPVLIFRITSPGIGLGFLIFFMIILIPVHWLMQRTLEQAQPTIVLQGLGLPDALKSGWKIVGSNLGSLILMSLMLGFINFLIVIIIGLFIYPVLLLFAGFSFVAYFGYAGGGSPVLFQGLIIGFAIYAFSVTFILNTFFTAYRKTIWTLSHLQLVSSMDANERPSQV